jgi:hypothetical protein
MSTSHLRQKGVLLRKEGFLSSISDAVKERVSRRRGGSPATEEAPAERKASLYDPAAVAQAEADDRHAIEGEQEGAK